MKSNEEYISDYIEKYTTLFKKGELWRIRVTLIEFIEGVERIRIDGEEKRKNNYFNEFAIQSSQNNSIEIMLMDNLTWEEKRAQVISLNEGMNEQFASESLLIIENLKYIKIPLKFVDIINIYRWLLRKQITLEMLPKNVLTEFKETRQYKTINNGLK